MWPPAVSSSLSCSAILQQWCSLRDDYSTVSQLSLTPLASSPTVSCRPSALLKATQFSRAGNIQKKPRSSAFCRTSKKQQCFTFPISPRALLLGEDEVHDTQSCFQNLRPVRARFGLLQGNPTSPRPRGATFGLSVEQCGGRNGERFYTAGSRTH